MLENRAHARERSSHVTYQFDQWFDIYRDWVCFTCSGSELSCNPNNLIFFGGEEGLHIYGDQLRI